MTGEDSPDEANGEATPPELQTVTNTYRGSVSLDPDEARRNKLLDASNRFLVFALAWGKICFAIILATLSAALVMVTIWVTLDHTIWPGALMTDQMDRIRSAAIGVRDSLAGSALLSSAVLFWLVRRGYIPGPRNSDDDS